MKKKIIALGMAVSMMLSAAPALAFDDVYEGDWYAEAINYMVQSGYMNGISETEFAPNAGMTRAMFVTVLGRMDGAYVDGYTKKIFPDVEMSEWYAKYVSWALENGIVSGFSDLKFHPNEQINRAQLAVMIKRYLDYRGITLADNPAAYEAFSDANKIPQWAADGVDLMRRTGIITGDSYGAFMPESFATRAQIATTIMKLRKVMNGEVLGIPGRVEQSKAEKILGDMTLEEKIYQMIALTPEQLTGISQATMGGQTTKDAIEKYPVGTIIYSENNVIDEAQITSMVNNTKEFAQITPFMAIEEEPGTYSVLSKTIGKDAFKDAYEYRKSEASEVEAAYKALGTNLLNCGFNLNIAPIADMWVEPGNTYIARRSFGNTYVECSANTIAAIKGTADSGILAAMKYFPGYGASKQNPENEKCVSDRTLDDLKNYEFNAYKEGIDAGADFVMCANVWMPKIDPYYPASLSTIFINDLLKKELGFEGVVMSGDFRMKSISQSYTSGDAAVRAIDAGCDIIVCPEDFNEAVQAIVKAVENDEISEKRINESVMKILEKKESAGIIK